MQKIDIQYIIVTIMVSLVVPMLSSCIKNIWVKAKDSNNPMRKKIIRFFVEKAFWYSAPFSILFSTYILFSRYGHSEHLTTASIGDVFLISAHVGIIFLMISMIFSQTIFSANKQTHQMMLDLLAGVISILRSLLKFINPKR